MRTLKNRNLTAIRDVTEFFEAVEQKQFKPSELAQIFAANRENWHLTQGMTVAAFTRFLTEKTKMAKIEFAFPSRKETRYTWGQPKLLPTVLSLREGAYFSHYTAMHLHGLTEQLPKTIYLSIVQSPPRERPEHLIQNSIDTAFKRSPRVSNAIAEFGDSRVTLLNPMGLGKLGIMEMAHGVDRLQVTDLEKTLIDATIRPHYSGGVFEVAKAFKEASARVSVNRIIALLVQLRYVYPYHQAIGYYAERSGQYSEAQLRLLEKPGLDYDFYLAHNLKQAEYVKKWRLYVPKGM